MGYSRTYNKTIHVSGSVTTSYPASKVGGVKTVHYSENVPVTINMYIDTDSFDASIVDQKARVESLTAAVAAMNTAQVLTINENSKLIADHMVDGFYNTINSELTLQQTEKKSDIQAKFGLMKSIADQIANTHLRMEDDLAKLKKHYSKIFSGLDEDLEKRIYELDKNAFNLSTNVKDGIVSGAYSYNIPVVINEINNTSSASLLISNARLNNKTSDIIDKMLSNVEANKDYMKSLSAVMDSESLKEATVEFVPAIVVNTSDLNDATKSNDNYYVADVAGKEKIASCLQQEHYEEQAFCDKKLSDEEKEIIENNLVLYIEDNQSSNEDDQRIYNEIMRMWKKDKERIQK